jgi:hypothetical protein
MITPANHSNFPRRTLRAGLALSLAMLLTFRALGFGRHGGGILLTSPLQSRKLIAV